MSRMLSFVAAEPMTTARAVGDNLLRQFGLLGSLHADGWGTAWLDIENGAIRTFGSPTAPSSCDAWASTLDTPSTARIVYLRFASRGAPSKPENIQPFLSDSAAFQHNGLIAPRDELLGLLPLAQRSALKGTTDSEAYFSVLQIAARGDGGWSNASLACGVASVRASFSDACLNAMVLSDSGLFVVHAAGGARAPLAAFAQRGADLDALPPGHDDDYNTLRFTTTDCDVHVVATTGVDQHGWTRLPDESVSTITHDRVTCTRVR